MAASPVLAPWVVLEDSVDLVERPVEREQEWSAIRCASKKAYGCGEHGQQLVEGLTLLARVGSPDPVASLRIRVEDQALKIIRAEFNAGDEPLVSIAVGGIFAKAAIWQAGDSFIVLSMEFQFGVYGERVYYLVYDAVARSLAMIPPLPKHRVSYRAMTPVPVRGGGNDYQLVHLASLMRREQEVPGIPLYDDTLCVWTPAAPPPAEPAWPHIAPWRRKERRFPAGHVRDPDMLFEHVSFSFKGQAFWADLSQGVVGCDLRAAGLSDVVDCDFIGLPPGHPFDIAADMDLKPATMFRTICAAGDSIKYVSIDYTGDIAERMVAVWTLHLDQKRWTQDGGAFSVRSLWGLEGFRRAGLQEMEPKCPFLTPDGASWWPTSA
ncbi:hypothetical protein ACP70R_024549 [Stipagrostis hirtigluma subsp. patula]